MEARRLANRRARLGSSRIATLYLGCVILCIAGCRQRTSDLFNPTARPPAVQSGYDDAPWAAVLREFVHDGLVDYRGLVKRPDNLEKFLDQIAFVGPTSTPSEFPDAPSRLAYYINAYNAGVFAAVLAAGVPDTMHDARQPALEYGFRFRLDGSIVTLARIRELARHAAEGNARVEFALCSAAMGSPKIADTPYRADGLTDRLIKLAARTMDDPDLVRVNHENQRLMIGLAIWTQRDAFIALYQRETASRSGTLLNCLMHFASGMRREYLGRATGYQPRLMPFDRALNIVSR